MKLQEAFDKLFNIAERTCDADIELPEDELNDVMTELWSVLRETKTFYTGKLPDWLRDESAWKTGEEK